MKFILKCLLFKGDEIDRMLGLMFYFNLLSAIFAILILLEI